MDPVYGFQSVNVEAQVRDPSSFLRWVAAYPLVGFAAALLFLAPNSIDDFPRALISTGIVVVVAVTTYLYVRWRTRCGGS